jgi:hypothetical protein
MTEPDPLNRLSRVANQPEQPSREFSDRLLDELPDELAADQTGPTGSSFDHTINETATEVMLSPERNGSPTRARTWWIATAASSAALALIGGLVAIGTRADEDPVPADQPEPTLPAIVEPDFGGSRLVTGSECGSGLASTNGLYEYAPVDGEFDGPWETEVETEGR